MQPKAVSLGVAPTPPPPASSGWTGPVGMGPPIPPLLVLLPLQPPAAASASPQMMSGPWVRGNGKALFIWDHYNLAFLPLQRQMLKCCFFFFLSIMEHLRILHTPVFPQPHCQRRPLPYSSLLQWCTISLTSGDAPSAPALALCLAQPLTAGPSLPQQAAFLDRVLSRWFQYGSFLQRPQSSWGWQTLSWLSHHRQQQPALTVPGESQSPIFPPTPRGHGTPIKCSQESSGATPDL